MATWLAFYWCLNHHRSVTNANLWAGVDPSSFVTTVRNCQLWMMFAMLTLYTYFYVDMKISWVYKRVILCQVIRGVHIIIQSAESLYKIRWCQLWIVWIPRSVIKKQIWSIRNASQYHWNMGLPKYPNRIAFREILIILISFNPAFFSKIEWNRTSGCLGMRAEEIVHNQR